jgi:threonine aldolase
MMNPRFFASDNCSGIHPQILESIADANHNHTKGYGYDSYTNAAEKAFKQLFGDDIEVFFVYSGTAANVLGLESCLRSFEAVICSDVAHIHTDEAGAPERFLQSKLITLPSKNGKITPEQIPVLLTGRGIEHHVQPKVISLTQSTEYGTIYSLDEIQAFSKLCKRENLFLHVDGARISNASVALNKSPREFIKEAGVDVMSFGGTKNGMMMGEAVIFFNRKLAESFKYQRKQGMQLASKMRFIAAQFLGFFKNDLWLETASHANQMASLLESELLKFPQIQITQPVQVNSIFAIFPEGIAEKLQTEFPFYVWDEVTNEVRLMCSWDTQLEDIHLFCKRIEELISL